VNPGLLALPAAFGLAGATGLNATLPLFIVSLLARLGLIHLAPPYDALASDIAFWGLLVLAVVEFAVDKVPALDSVGHAVMLPVAAAAGAILFASQTGAISSMDSGLGVLVSLLAGGAIAGTVHVARATVRPVVNLAFLGPAASVIEDSTSAALSLAATLAPVLVPFLLLLIALAVAVLWERRRAIGPRRSY
jgi:Domain of unknown function (DUF4126)